MANVNVQTGANFQELAQILSPIIQEIGNTVDAEVGFEDELVKLGFTMGAVNTPGGEITSMV